MKHLIRKTLRLYPPAYKFGKSISNRYYEMTRISLKEMKGKSEAVRTLALFLSGTGIKSISPHKKGLLLSVSSPVGEVKFTYHKNVKNDLLTLPLSGKFEEEETEFLLSKIGRSSVVFDVGANFGWYSVLLSKTCRKVVSFEPVAFERLSENLRNNKCANVTEEKLALGETSGEVVFTVPEDLGDAFASRISDYGTRIKVEMVRLDDYVEKNKIGKIDLIKVDIEGGEFGFLKGAERTLKTLKPALFMEHNPYSCERFGHKIEDIISWLSERGYEVTEKVGEMHYYEAR